MITEKPYFQLLLKTELAKRCEKNPSYSLRAFAQSLSLDAGTLSGIINGKRPISLTNAERIVEKLNCRADQKLKFISSVVSVQKSRKLKRQDPRIKNISIPEHRSPKSLEIDLFHLISDWHHAAILELTYQENFSSSADWIARQLGISSKVAKQSIERLLEFGLLEKVDGKLIKSNDHLELKMPFETSSARKKKQIQIREKAISAIKNDSIKTRHMSSITMCIDPALIPEARRRIEEFNDSLCAFLESGKRKQVYSMEIGLFSLQKTNEKGEN